MKQLFEKLIQKNFLFLCIHLINTCYGFIFIQKPVVDMSTLKNCIHMYDEKLLGYSYLHTPKDVPRSIQALQGEWFKIVDETPHEYCIQHPYYYYLNNETEKKLINFFWVSKTNATFISHENMKFFYHKFTPFLTKEYTECQNTLTLILPITIDTSTYSIGTRFYYANITKDTVDIIIQRPSECSFLDLKDIIVSIPRNFCLLDSERKELQEQSENKIREYFVNFLLKIIEYANKNNGIFPYVWGGGSLSGLLPKDAQSFSDTNNLCWNWKNIPNEQIKTGCDCSSLVALLWRISGLPFFLRNTVAQKEYLKHVNKIKNGDILWVPRHEFILCIVNGQWHVADISGYATGYASLTIMPLQDRFENVTYIEDLEKILKTNGSLIVKTSCNTTIKYDQIFLLDPFSCKDSIY